MRIEYLNSLPFITRMFVLRYVRKRVFDQPTQTPPYDIIKPNNSLGYKMTYQFTPNPIPLAIAALISAALAWYTWRHRRTTGAAPFSWMMLILFQWGASYIFH